VIVSGVYPQQIEKIKEKREVSEDSFYFGLKGKELVTLCTPK
jgi:hypothetical protein